MPANYIARDFALTRGGIEPFRDLLNMKLTGGKPLDLSNEKLKQKMQLTGSAK